MFLFNQKRESFRYTWLHITSIMYSCEGLLYHTSFRFVYAGNRRFYCRKFVISAKKLLTSQSAKTRKQSLMNKKSAKVWKRKINNKVPIEKTLKIIYMERQTNRFCFVLYFNLILVQLASFVQTKLPTNHLFVSATIYKSKFSKTFYRCK